jgi:hypothetical protein
MNSRTRTALIVLLILLAGAGIGVLLRESDSGGTAHAANVDSRPSVPSTELVANTRPPETITPTSTGDTAAAPPTTSLAIGTQSGGGTQSNTVPIKPPTQTQTQTQTHATAAPTTTTTTLPKPAFTIATATPGAVYCNGTNTPPITIQWATKNATSVDLQLEGQGPRTEQPVAAKFMGPYACSSGYATLTAHGPGGDTTVTVNWNHLQAPPG